MGCKVDSLAKRYDLSVPDPAYDSIDAYLVARWTGADGRPSEGYKPLTRWFNERVLRRVYESHDRDAMDVHLSTEYDVLTGDEDLRFDELAADLSTDGIDVEQLQREFVSWSTMRHHLKGCLEASKEAQSPSTDWELNSVKIAQEQTKSKAKSVLRSLASKDRLPQADKADVDVQVKLTCPECSVRVPLEDALGRGYVCEQHFEDDSSNVVTERGMYSLALGAVYVATEAFLSISVDHFPSITEVIVSSV